MTDKTGQQVDIKQLTSPYEIEFMTIYRSLRPEKQKEIQIMLSLMPKNKK